MDRDSREYLRVPVTADVTLDQAVEVAVVRARARPAAGDWRAAVWTGAAGMRRTARLDPGWADGLDPGVHDVWVRVTDDPEIPVVHAGQLVII